MQNLSQLLAANPYPGRGIILGIATGGMRAYLAYFIMGRSANSRNRVFAARDGGIVTRAADESKVEDPSLILYAPVRRYGEDTIVTNGDQTDTVYQCLAGGGTFEEALRTRTFEPDAPNFTSRISGLLSLGYSGFAYKLAILKSPDGGKSLQRHFWEYPQPQPGQGHFIHTYAESIAPLPPFAGEPLAVSVTGALAEFGDSIWQHLNEDNKISLYVRSITLDGQEETKIYNKYTPA